MSLVLRFGLAFLFAVALAGCQFGAVETTEPPPPDSRTDTPDSGRIGDAITIVGGGSELEVVVKGVTDPLPTGPADRTLRPGARFVGVDMIVRNIGGSRYSGSLVAGSRLLGPGGRSEGVTLLTGRCSVGFSSSLMLRPGERRSGCVAFEVPASARPRTYVLALNAGVSAEVGRWALTPE